MGTVTLFLGYSTMTLPDKEPNPDQRRLIRGSKGSGVGPLAVLLLIGIAAFAAYALFAM